MYLMFVLSYGSFFLPLLSVSELGGVLGQNDEVYPHAVPLP